MASISRRKLISNLRPLRAISTTSTISTCQPTPLSTTHRGTAFEERSLKLLQDHFSMSLKRVGGKEDGGIDLLGWWWLPPIGDLGLGLLPRRRIRVLGQCKAEKKKIGPKYVREMEGVLHRFLATSKWPNPARQHCDSNSPEHSSFRPTQFPLIALLISESPFTKATLLRAYSSQIPFFLLHLPPINDITHEDIERIPADWGTAIWNPSLSGTDGLLAGQIEIRWERSLGGGGRPGLWWKDQKLHSWTPDVSSLEFVGLRTTGKSDSWGEIADEASVL